MADLINRLNDWNDDDDEDNEDDNKERILDKKGKGSDLEILLHFFIVNSSLMKRAKRSDLGIRRRGE